MEEFRKLKKEDLYQIMNVAMKSYSRMDVENYVMDDILSSFDNNQRYKIELYGFFRNGILVHFSCLAKQLGIGGSYELRLGTTLPEFRRMGYCRRSIERRIAIIAERERNYKCLIQVTTRLPELFEEFEFKRTGYESRTGFIHMIKEMH